VRGFFDWLDTKKYKLHVRVFMSKYRGYTLCPDCEGARLRQEARDVRVGGKTLPEVSALSIKDAAIFFDTLELLPEQSAIAGPGVVSKCGGRLRFMVDVGLDYLTLNRLARLCQAARRKGSSWRNQSGVFAGRRAVCAGRTFRLVCTRVTTIV